MKYSLREIWQGGLARIPTPTHGNNVYSKEWDTLIILDACRPDILQDLSPEYDYLPDTIQTNYSVGSQSLEWIQNTFTAEYSEQIENTTYITANPYSRELDGSTFADMVEVWRNGWDESVGTVLPKSVTNTVAKREIESKREIIHYLQPHAPYLSLDMDSPGISEQGEIESHTTVWDMLESGSLSKQEAIEAYRDNLRWVLDQVEILLDIIESEKVVITADHGECFGEWGLYSHPPIPVPQLRRVPWVAVDTTSGDKPETYTDLTLDETASLEEMLTSLGYKG